jgi:hypothetical protein
VCADPEVIVSNYPAAAFERGADFAAGLRGDFQRFWGGPSLRP